MRISLRKLILAMAAVLVLSLTTKARNPDGLEQCLKQYTGCVNDRSSRVDCDAQYDSCLELVLALQ